jgi:HemK-related putative methylase
MSASDPMIPNRYVRALWLAWFALIRPFVRRRLRRPVLEWVDGRSFLVLPQVHNPVVFRSGRMLATAVASFRVTAPRAGGAGDSRGPRALDMGTGCGIGAVFAAAHGYQVVAVDINPEAVRCARINACLNRLENRIDLRTGDLFEPVAGERFDLVLFNPPFFCGESRDLLDLAWRGTDVLERFAVGLPSALEREGLALILLSSDGEGERLLSTLHAQGLRVAAELRRNLGNEIMTVYSARPPQ